MTTGRSGADQQRRSAVDPAIGQIRGFFKLFSTWVFQALCSEVPLEARESLGLTPGNPRPAWRWFLERLPKSREDASIGIPADLDAVLTLLSSGDHTEFKWLGPWSRLFDAVPEARALLAFAGLEFAEAFRKVKEPCSTEFIRKAVDVYHGDEQTLLRDVATYPGVLNLPVSSPTLKIGRLLVEYWLHGTNPSYSHGAFGPGAVAEKLDHIDRATMLPSWRPVYHHIVEPCSFESREEWRAWELTHDWAYPPVPFPSSTSSRMVAVPKTSTKPRLIAAEPAAQSWRQQSLMATLKARMKKYPYLDITDQSHNQRLCLRGLATIDQSRASDRIADTLVLSLFPENWAGALNEVRTPRVQCLCGETHELAKYAGMGSATTFPVETLVFAACALSRAYLEMGGDPDDDRHAVVSWLESQEAADVWGFYGDDAVVPNDLFEPISDEYRCWGLIPNASKSYHGDDRFRESCGVMVYLFHDQWIEVSPVRFASWPDGSTKVASSAKIVEVFNRLRLKIYLLTGEAVNCDPEAWTKIPPRRMLWDYSNIKDLLWNPKGFGWWDGELVPVSPTDYQQNWHQWDETLKPGVTYQTKCNPDGEIPPSALHVCLARVRGSAYVVDRNFLDQESGKPLVSRYWVIPADSPTIREMRDTNKPSVLREPRPKKVVAVLSRV